MNVVAPDILTLLTWAEQLASGNRCAAWEAWCAAAPDAASKWEHITQAQALLASGLVRGDDDVALPPEELAAFAEGQLAALDAHRVEQACWQSPALLAELLSAARFASQPVATEVSPALEARLLALTPRPAPHRANGQAFKYRLANDEPAKRNGKPAPAPAPQVASPAPASRAPDVAPASPAPAVAGAPARMSQSPAAWHWPLLAAALSLAIVLSGAVGWLAATWRHSATQQQPLARGQAEDVEPEPQPPTVQSPAPSPSVPLPSAPPHLPASSQSTAPTTTPPARSPASPQSDVDPATRQPLVPRPAPGPPKHRPRVTPAPPELAFQSPQGLLLVDPGLRGTWRVAAEQQGLTEPLKVLSLAESWTTIEVPGVGTLVFEGDAEGALATLPDGSLEVRLAYGRMGIENLRSGTELRLLTLDAAWTLRGIGDHSTAAVVCDPVSSGLAVPRGSLAIDDLEVAEGQMVRWLDGVPQAAQALTSGGAASSLQGIAPPAVNPWDLSWLVPPDEASRKQWRTTYGRLAERLTTAADVGGELIKVAATTRDPRQAALAARWSAAANPLTRSEQTWTMLMDRRAVVRAAGVRSLLELPPSDLRRVAALQLLHDKLGAALAKRVDEWLWTAWQPGPPSAALASDLVEHLQHGELSVRQIAVSLLELHTAAVFRQLERSPPAFDAAAPPSRRAAGYAEWKAVMVQLYKPGQKQPALVDPAQQRRALNAGQAVP